MPGSWISSARKRLLSDYGMILVLIALAVFFSYATWREQFPADAEAGRQVASRAAASLPPGSRVLIVSHGKQDANQFVQAADEALSAGGFQVAGKVIAEGPPQLRAELDRLAADEARRPAAIVATREASQWPLLRSLGRSVPGQEDNYIRLAYSGIDVPEIEEGLKALKEYFEA